MKDDRAPQSARSHPSTDRIESAERKRGSGESLDSGTLEVAVAAWGFNGSKL